MLAAGVAGFLIAQELNSSFESLSPEEKYQRIISQRDQAIRQAVAAGDYNCCINPACTMCYMAANQWNNFKAGTCACDQLIAQGKDPCPQCKKGLCNKNEDGFCLTIKDS